MTKEQRESADKEWKQMIEQAEAELDQMQDTDEDAFEKDQKGE